jgi:hypothetical protein
MDNWEHVDKLSSLHCRFGCIEPPVALVEFQEGGCICYPDQIQALCMQHLITTEPMKGARVILTFD